MAARVASGYAYTGDMVCVVRDGYGLRRGDSGEFTGNFENWGHKEFDHVEIERYGNVFWVTGDMIAVGTALPESDEGTTNDGIKEDVVNHPSHYNYASIEPLDVIEDWGLPYHPGNALKYVARHRHKGTAVQDIRKAIFYLNRYADLLESGENA